MPEALLHTITDTCEMLGISRATLYRLHRDGEIDFVKVKRLSLVSEEEIRRYLATITPQREYVRRYIHTSNPLCPRDPDTLYQFTGSQLQEGIIRLDPPD
jgi:excisionase family DNA binding protein